MIKVNSTCSNIFSLSQPLENGQHKTSRLAQRKGRGLKKRKKEATPDKFLTDWLGKTFLQIAIGHSHTGTVVTRYLVELWNFQRR